MKKALLGMGLLALCGGMMACADEDCGKDYDDCVAACTPDNKEECEKACLDAKNECEDDNANANACVTPLIIQEVRNMKEVVNYAGTDIKNCVIMAANLATYTSDNLDSLEAAVTNWSAFNNGDAGCILKHSLEVASALLTLYTIYTDAKSCETTLLADVTGAYSDATTKMQSALQGLGTVEGLQAALDAASASTGK